MQNMNGYMITVHFWNKLFLNVSHFCFLTTLSWRWRSKQDGDGSGRLQISPYNNRGALFLHILKHVPECTVDSLHLIRCQLA